MIKSKVRKAVLFPVLLLLILAALAILLPDAIIRGNAAGKILPAAGAGEREDVQLILVLGCGVKKDGTPSDMLRDRVMTAVNVYEAFGGKTKLLMSGDRSGEDYNEPEVMKALAEESGVNPDDILCDYEGFSTYESILRIRTEYGAMNIVIVSQEYHLPRALWIAKSFGVEAVGVSASVRTYRGQFLRDLREILARDKDFLKCIFTV